MITVACVFNATVPGGTTAACYDPSWVQKLKKNVAKYLSAPHRFVCLTNSTVPGVECIPLQEPGWKGWWCKIELLNPQHFKGPVLYLDLDVFATGPLDEFAKPRLNPVMLRDHFPHLKNNSIMYWDGNDERMHAIYHAFKANTEEAMMRHQGINSLGDQGYMIAILQRNGHTIDVWQDLMGEKGFVPFSFSSKLNPALSEGVLPEATRMVYCLGHPKFHQYRELSFVKQYWPDL